MKVSQKQMDHICPDPKSLEVVVLILGSDDDYAYLIIMRRLAS